MTAPWSEILAEMGFGSINVVLNLLKVLIPLMVIIELIFAYKIIEKIAPKLGWFCKLVGISKDALVPLLVGLLIGVTYGAAAISEMGRKNPLSKRDMALLGIFLFGCHGILETTYLFGLAGASVLFVSVLRFLIALGVTVLAARIIHN